MGTWVPGTEARPLRWAPGLLDSGGGPTVVLIPDLAALELAAARACVAAVGADVLHLERAGRSDRWPPDLYWLGGCRRIDLGRIAPHLLDRFPVRLPAALAQTGDLVADLRAAVAEAGPPGPRPELARMVEDVKAARTAHTVVGDVFLDRILERVTVAPGPGSRRPLALARLTGEAAVEPRHVDAAADALGLALPGEGRAPRPQPDPAVVPTADADTGMSASATAEAGVEVVARPVAEPGSARPTETVPLPAVAPYAEDGADVARESASLRLPPVSALRSTVRRGAVIGPEPATDLRDLAMVPTLLEAAKFRAVRGGTFAVAATDLRRHRRAPATDYLFVFVLDHTAACDPDWSAALLPYLHQAYVNRSGIGVVQVGAADAADEFRATCVTARSLLVPAVGAALAAGPGTATPLAHGLELALDAVRRGPHRGCRAATEATLVVYTDDRGNVPLKVSATGRMEMPVGRGGVEDALRVAAGFRAISRLTRLVLAPPLTAARGLPEQLAMALGAGVVRVAELEGPT